MATNRDPNNPPYNSQESAGIRYHLQRPVLFERVWRYADGQQEPVPAKFFHDPYRPLNSSENNPPTNSTPYNEDFRRFQDRYISFNPDSGTWEFSANQEGQPYTIYLPVSEQAFSVQPIPTPAPESDEEEDDSPVASSSQTPRPQTPPSSSGRANTPNSPTPFNPPPPTNPTPAAPVPTTQTNMANNTAIAKIELKTKFDGSADRVREIVKHCEWKFALDPNFTTNFQKSVYLLSCCEGGTAGPWAVEYSDNREEAVGNGVAVETVWKWETVKKAFQDYFLPRSQISSAIAAMTTLKQTGTVKEYVAKFRSLASQSGQPVAANENYFIKGLNKGLGYKVVAQDPNGRDTYEKLYALTERLDEAFQMMPKEDRREQGSRKPYQRPSARYQSRGKGNWRQEIRKVEEEDVTIGKLTPEKRKKCIEEGRCFSCREVGHMASECPNRDRFQKNIRRTETDGNAADRIRSILKDLDDSARKEAMEALEGQGF